MKHTIKRQMNEFDRQNAQAAGVVLSDPERYAGLPLEWAKLWRERHPDAQLEIEPKPAKHYRAA